jgi:two-component system response regulator ChvI
MKRTPTILVVDDELPIIHILVELLGEEGYVVRVARDGASALIAIRESPPDLVVLDVAMPVMTGEELLHILRTTDFPTLPVIIATAGLNPERFLAQGATAVVSKPFELEPFLATVDRALKQR